MRRDDICNPAATQQATQRSNKFVDPVVFVLRQHVTTLGATRCHISPPSAGTPDSPEITGSRMFFSGHEGRMNSQLVLSGASDFQIFAKPQITATRPATIECASTPTRLFPSRVHREKRRDSFGNHKTPQLSDYFGRRGFAGEPRRLKQPCGSVSWLPYHRTEVSFCGKRYEVAFEGRELSLDVGAQTCDDATRPATMSAPDAPLTVSIPLSSSRTSSQFTYIS